MGKIRNVEFQKFFSLPLRAGISQLLQWLGYRLDDPRFGYQQGTKYFFFPSRNSRPAIRPTHSRSQWTPSSFRWDKVAGTWSWSPSSAKNVWSYSYAPPARLYGDNKETFIFYLIFYVYLIKGLVRSSGVTSCYIVMLMFFDIINATDSLFASKFTSLRPQTNNLSFTVSPVPCLIKWFTTDGLWVYRSVRH
jgi:hypothetical protein